jgi:hypothetical protein
METDVRRGSFEQQVGACAEAAPNTPLMLLSADVFADVHH